MTRLFSFFSLIWFGLLLCHCSGPQSAGNNAKPENKELPDSSWALIPFIKIDSVNPILQPSVGSFPCPIRKQKIFWEEKDVFNPAVAVRGDSLYLLYRAQDKVGKPDGTSRIGLAVSTDGFHFVRFAHPVLYPDNDDQKKYEWEGGCEDPRVVEDSLNNYYMTYTAFDGRLPRLMLATSKDLVHWKKHGPAFAKAYGGKYLDKWSKSGSIVSIYDRGRIVATRINGKYWMYWGDQNIWLAVSDDLINWTPVEKEKGDSTKVRLKGVAAQMPDLKIALATRDDKFDNDLVESGPPAMLTSNGVLLLYNSRTMSSSADTSLQKGSYAPGQALFEKNNPSRMIARMNLYFMKPEKSYELSGQVNKVCFVEALAYFRNMWLLYYGTADSKIAVAVSHANPR
ncbi:MAG: glycosidase [Bacteroidetes bacterium]|nr:MAG: glycosidase [Bacteroidota bacterium]